MKDEDLTLETFRNLCTESLFPEIPSAPKTISIKTSSRWMRYLGFQPKLQIKGYYTKNRADVIEYRDNTFLPRMAEYERRMEEYSGEDMEVITPPDLREGDKRVVLITHLLLL